MVPTWHPVQTFQCFTADIDRMATWLVSLERCGKQCGKSCCTQPQLAVFTADASSACRARRVPEEKRERAPLHTETKVHYGPARQDDCRSDTTGSDEARVEAGCRAGHGPPRCREARSKWFWTQ